MRFEVQKEAEFDCHRVVAVFRHLFLSEYDTLLVAGGEEPIYLPAEKSVSAKIIFREDFFASALHEVAHWCIAGANRRRLPDYGYWYCPDGRTGDEQARFERVEIKPQALEWIFSVACGYPFRVSVDNLLGNQEASPQFKCNLLQQVWMYCATMPPRARQFTVALAQEFGCTDVLQRENFCLADLR